MIRWISLLAVVLSLGAVDRALAQESSAGPGQAEITIIPGGAVVFTESKDVSAPSFGNYQLGAAISSWRSLPARRWCRTRPAASAVSVSSAVKSSGSQTPRLCLRAMWVAD